MRSFFIYLLFSFLGTGLFGQARVIHVLVALCDNDSQGIVPVPKKTGNGNDPDNNLYWGCGYGVRTFFKCAAEWHMVSRQKSVSPDILERCIFKHISKDVYLVADAYKGNHIKKCNEDLFRSASGNSTDTAMLKEQVIDLGTAQLICYVGHDGLMDFAIDNYPQQKNNAKKDVMILACASRMYYRDGMQAAGANPLLWTTNLMCPEAYTLKAAIDGWLLNESGDQIHLRAAETYDQYQKCGINGAKNLFATGW
jgi:hypothetical protein